MANGLFSTEPLRKVMLKNCQLDPQKQTSVKFKSKLENLVWLKKNPTWTYIDLFWKQHLGTNISEVWIKIRNCPLKLSSPKCKPFYLEPNSNLMSFKNMALSQSFKYKQTSKRCEPTQCLGYFKNNEVVLVAGTTLQDWSWNGFSTCTWLRQILSPDTCANTRKPE